MGRKPGWQGFVTCSTVHRVLRICGNGTKIVLVPLPPAVCRAIDRAVGSRDARAGPAEQPRYPDGPAAATRCLRYLATTAGIQVTHNQFGLSRSVRLSALAASPSWRAKPRLWRAGHGTDFSSLIPSLTAWATTSAAWRRQRVLAQQPRSKPGPVLIWCSVK